MTARQPARKPAAKRIPAAQTAQKTARKPADKPADPAPKPAKLVRKGRRVTAGASVRRELSWPKANYSAKLLIAQAARLADRLEVLARLLDGDAKAWLAVQVSGVVVEVRVDDVVREERQLSEVLRKLIGDIGKMRAIDEGGMKGGPGPVDPLPAIVAEHYANSKRT